MVVYMALGVCSYGQTISHVTNAPRCGDVIMKKPLAFFSTSNEGQGVLWDFGDLATDGNEKERTEYYFDEDSVLCSLDSRMVQKLQLSDDSLKLVGYETKLEKMDYPEPLVMVTYPFSYGYTIDNNYEGIGSYCQNLIMKNSGSQFVEADAEGRIVTEEGDTLNHVIRLHTIRTSSVGMYSQEDTLFSDTTFIKQEIKEINQWFVRGYRYPLYETSSTAYYDHMDLVSTILSAYMYSTDEEDALEDEVNEEIKKDVEKENLAAKDIIHYVISNEGSRLSLDYSLDADASINALICNIRGMVYGRESAHHPAGSGYNMSFDMSSLPKDQYILYLNVNGKVYNEKFNVR